MDSFFYWYFLYFIFQKMLKLIQIDRVVFNNRWTISPLNGGLYKHPINVDQKKQVIRCKDNAIIDKISNALYLVDNPYELVPVPLKSNLNKEKIRNKQAEVIYSILRRIGNKNFLTSLIYSFLRKEIFDHTQEAFDFLATLPSESDIDENCLQKSLFVAKTSRSFRENGVIFIGAHIPTSQMHAWVIENNRQYDTIDRVWVNYTPLLAITN